eukprot:361569-Chlamydomonas_euryale.AAC.2
MTALLTFCSRPRYLLAERSRCDASPAAILPPFCGFRLCRRQSTLRPSRRSCGSASRTGRAGCAQS